MGRTENVEIFKDTENLCKNNSKLKASLENSRKNQRLISEDAALGEIDLNKYEKAAEVMISKKRSFEAAKAYKDLKVCVHNFASATNPGGGVVKGSTAQEECLCRCSGLYFALNTPGMWDGFYQKHRDAWNPLNNDDIIYTPLVTVFKSDTAVPQLMPETEWYDVNVITCAAPNLRKKPSNAYNPNNGNGEVKITDQELLALHEKRLARILDVAVLENNEVIILGAFGCGAFLNNPSVVARAAKNVIGKYRYAFKTIEFAVYCSPQDERNYLTFSKMLG